MDDLRVAAGAAEFLSAPVIVATIALVLVGRLLPIGLASRVWIRIYLVVFGVAGLALVAYWVWFLGIDPDNRARDEAFLVGAFLSGIVLPLTAAAVVGSLWRYRIP